MKNSNLWLALGRNLLISIGIYGALMLLLWGAQAMFDYESCISAMRRGVWVFLPVSWA